MNWTPEAMFSSFLFFFFVMLFPVIYVAILGRYKYILYMKEHATAKQKRVRVLSLNIDFVYWVLNIYLKFFD